MRMRNSNKAQIRYGQGNIIREETERCFVSMETKELWRFAEARLKVSFLLSILIFCLKSSVTLT